MSGSARTKFDEAGMETLRLMAPDHAPAEIARALNSTPASVGAMARRYGITLGDPLRISITVSTTVMATLEAEARRRARQAKAPYPVNRLVRRILRAVAEDNLFDALLTEPRGPNTKNPD
jgi:hypothetical protein